MIGGPHSHETDRNVLLLVIMVMLGGINKYTIQYIDNFPSDLYLVALNKHPSTPWWGRRAGYNIIVHPYRLNLNITGVITKIYMSALVTGLINDWQMPSVQ